TSSKAKALLSPITSAARRTSRWDINPSSSPPTTERWSRERLVQRRRERVNRSGSVQHAFRPIPRRRHCESARYAAEGRGRIVKPSEHWRLRARSAEEVVSLVASGARAFVHGAAATPTPLLDALSARSDLDDVTLYHLHLSGPCAFVDKPTPGVLSHSLFTGPALRRPVEEGRAEFIPVFLSDIPALFTSRGIPLDVALLQLSPPDAHGNCTLGTSVDAAKAAADTAGIVLAEINDRMPRTHGNSVVPFDRVAAFVHTSRPLHAAPTSTPSETEQRIGELVAD